ncbi:MAG TPA: autotransporter-associated beta strand repeat-containing protein, partial [Prosthecobacter sp.]|nr:autotransporter-associated beta strand repeat-containing protein [Prosthecobacter sp.]
NTFGDNGNIISLGDTSGSANVTLQATNSFTYQQPINVVAGNTGVVSIIAGTSTGNVIFSGPITLNNHGITLGKTGTTGASQFTGGITGAGDVTISNTATTGTITLATGVVNPTGSITHTSTASGTTTISAVIGSNVTGVTQSSTTSQLTLSGDNLYTTLTTVGAGTTVNIGAGGTTGSILGDVLNNGTLTFNRSNSYTYAGDISGTGTINKLGAGTLALSGTLSYAGATTISGGALAGNLSGNNLVLNGGVREASGTFTRSLGTGAGQVQWAAGANGGFSAQGGPLTVTLSGAPSVLVWDSTPNFVSGAGQLVFGSITSDDVVTFTHDLDLNASGSPATRTVQVLDNAASTADKTVLSGTLSSSGASVTFAKTGAGVLELTGANTYQGATTNTTGTLIFSGSNSGGGTTTLASGVIQLNSDNNGGLATGTLTLTAGTLQAINAARTISNDVLLTAVTASGNQALTLTGTVTGNTGGSRTLTSSITGATLTLGNIGINNDSTAARTLTIAGTGVTALTGAISNGNADAFANGLTITNTNVTTLSGANKYSGVTTMNAAAGTLVLSGSNSSAGATTLTTGTLQFNSNSNGGLASGLLTLTAGTLQALNEARAISNAVTLTAATVSGSQNFTFNGKITGNTGASRTLTSSIAGGILTLTDIDLTNDTGATGRTLTIAGTGNTHITGTIANGAGTTVAHNFQVTNTGTTTLSGTLAYTGTTTLNSLGGTLVLSGSAVLPTANLVVTAGTLHLNAAAQSIAALTMGGGVATSFSTLQIAAGQTLTLGGNVTYVGTNNPLAATLTGGAGAALDFGGAGRTFNVANSTAVVVDMIIGADVALQNDAGGGLIKQGTGTLRIDGANNLTGPLSIEGGAVIGNVGTGNLVLNGGVFEGSGTFTRALGAGSGQVRWAANAQGGFAAQGGALLVTLGSADDPLVWDGTAHFVSGTGGLLFGSLTADSTVTFSNNIDLNSAVRTVSVVDNTTALTDKAVLSGVLSNGGLTKTGNGALQLTGANTFNGPVTVTAGTLEFSTVSNNGGSASNLGQGSDGVFLGGGILSFVGATDQATNRAISLSAGSTLDASGTGTITYNSAVTAFASTTGFQVTLGGSGNGVLNGAITQAGTSADLIKAGSGTWRIDVAQPGLGDDVIVNGGVLILNAANFHDGDDFFIRTATVKLGVNGALTSDMDDLQVSGETASGAILDIAGTTGSAPVDIILGATGLSGSIIDSVGGGSIGATGTFTFRNGTVSASLTGATPLNKTTQETVTLAGTNPAYTGVTTLSQGTIVLDFTSNNGEKLSNTGAAALTGNGGTLIINGNSSANTLETLGGFTLSAGGTHIQVNAAGSQTATFNLAGITRTAVGGTVDFVMSSPNALIQTSTANAFGNLLGGYATVDGAKFATVLSGAIAGLDSTVKNDLGTWLPDEDLTDSSGFTGTVNNLRINSVRFDAAGGSSTVAINSGNLLLIRGGGILVTGDVGSGTASIAGGFLMSGNAVDLIIHQNNTGADFTISSDIIGPGFTKSGAGNVLLSGTNSYSGQTTINEGKLTLAGGQAIADFSAVSIKHGPGVILDLGNSIETIGTLAGGGSDGGLVAIGTGKLTINESSSTTYSGLISGSGALIKTGAGTLTLDTGAHTFSGALIINQGQINLNDRTDANFSALGSLTLNAGGLVLDFTAGTESSPNKINNNAGVTMLNTS